MLCPEARYGRCEMVIALEERTVGLFQVFVFLPMHFIPLGSVFFVAGRMVLMDCLVDIDINDSRCVVLQAPMQTLRIRTGVAHGFSKAPFSPFYDRGFRIQHYNPFPRPVAFGRFGDNVEEELVECRHTAIRRGAEAGGNRRITGTEKLKPYLVEVIEAHCVEGLSPLLVRLDGQSRRRHRW